jgi:hypothetical protein
MNIPSIDNLHKEKTIKQDTKKGMFKVVLNKCVEKILYTNRHTDKTFVIFEVPKILIGYPLYDMKSCILYIINELVKHNYMVEFLEPFYLYIDWGKSNVSNSNKITTKLQEDTKTLLKKFPNTSKVEYVYVENYPNTTKKSITENKLKKNKKKGNITNKKK